MAKNILIFSDGTGQKSGVSFDENRTNIYKLYRATRVSPDSNIDPTKQIAFYDAGIGTNNNEWGYFSRAYNIICQATGLGLTTNIIDCYSFIIANYEVGDRIYLFGFSRGAYTVRCLSAVLALCGIPTCKDKEGKVTFDKKTIKQIASEAVNKVYKYVSKNVADKSSQKILDDITLRINIRKEIAEQFRENYSSVEVNPYFIGVFDTVAEVGNIESKILTGIFALIFNFILSTLIYTYNESAFHFNMFCKLDFWKTFAYSFVALGFITALLNLISTVKYACNLKSYSFLQTLHRTYWKLRFPNKTLNPNVMFARHALAIDEHRSNFDRVPWGDNTQYLIRKAEQGELPQLRQIWFAGNHADIGGGYPENESRLSDISLKWMIEQLNELPEKLEINTNILATYIDTASMQHDETKGIAFKFAGKKVRTIKPDATLHPSVIQRMKAIQVLHFDEKKPYRPENLREHNEVSSFYLPIPPSTL